MRNVVKPKIKFKYEELKDNEEIVQKMYNKIFEIAKQNILAKRKQRISYNKVKSEGFTIEHKPMIRN